MPFKLSRNNAITLGGFAVLISGFLLAGYLPYLRQSQQLRRDILNHQSAKAEAASKSDRLKELTSRSHFLRLQVRDYDRLVPNNKDLGTFLGQLSGELDAAGMRDTAVRAMPPTALGKCQQLPIEVRGRGMYQQFHSFLTSLETLPRMSSINHLNLETDTALTGQVTIDLTLAIYNTKPAP